MQRWLVSVFNTISEWCSSKGTQRHPNCTEGVCATSSKDVKAHWYCIATSFDFLYFLYLFWVFWDFFLENGTASLACVSLNGGSWHKQSGEHNGPFCLHSICCPTCFFLLHSTFVCTSSSDSFYKVSSGWLEVAFSMLHPSFICLYVQSKALEIPDVKMFQWKQMC